MGEILMVMNNAQEVTSMVNPTISAPQPAIAGHPIRISQHAVQRYQERVDPAAPAVIASAAIHQILSTGSVRPQPRDWTTCRVEPGMRFVYSADGEDVCLVLRDLTVVTVLTVELCARSLDRGYTSAPRRLRSWQQRMEDEADIYEPLPDDLAMVA